MRLLALIALVGCYQPTAYGNCALACQPAIGCPGDLQCVLVGASHRCVASNQTCDGETDASIDPDANDCIGIATAPLKPFIQYCPRRDFGAAVPDELVVNAPLTIQTPAMCDAMYPPGSLGLCVKIAKTITINSRLRATGPHPLLLVATSALTVTAPGVVDVSGSPDDRAANANVFDSDGGNIEGGGGAGGSFLTMGGRGGHPKGMATGGPNAISGEPSPTQLRGGCAGGPGGNNATSSAGSSGGAVYLLARTMVIDGEITAAGAPGAGGGGSGVAGGGGGGSGGMIILDSHSPISLDATARINALGGGGGGGGEAANAGDPGSPPASRPSVMRGTGGLGGGVGGRGGDGSALTLTETPVVGPGGDGGSVNGGGGGGGGGGAAGIILTHPIVTFPPGTVAPQ